MLPNLTTHHLWIPPEFVKYISNEESNRAILEGPTGSQWHVKLCKSEDDTYLQDGWQDFVRDHSLCHYEFLVFRYDGNMCFNVRIFDKSGYERADTFTTKTQRLISPIEKKFDRSVGTKRGRPPNKSAGSAALFQSRASNAGKRKSRLPKKCPGSVGRLAYLFPDFARGTQTGLVDEKRTETEDISLPTRERESQAGRQQMGKNKDRVSKVTESFSSSHPYFAKCLDWYTVARKFVLHIPAGFAKAHLPHFSSKVILQTSRGKQVWTVNLKCTRLFSFCGGWPAFVHDNKLKEGDICIFELVGKREFCVHIFPVGTH